MEDFYIIKKFKLLIILIIIFIILFTTYKILSNISNKNFNKYLEDNNYIEERNNVKTLTKNNTDTYNLSYQALYENNILTKNIHNENEDTLETEIIRLYYKKNKTIYIEYNYSYYVNNKYRAFTAKAKYKNKKIEDYKIISGTTNSNIEEKILNESSTFYNELENILNEYKIIPQLINIENKDASN